MIRRTTSAVCSAAVALLSFGCASAPETIMNGVDPFGWDEATVVEYDNRDTVSLRDLALTIRYGAALKDNRLPLTITTMAPDSTCISEQKVFFLECRPGPAATAAVENIVYRRSARLSQQGTYSVTIEPHVPLKGVEAVGITFEKAEQTWEKTN
ncbi:MAG: hypothetical protein J6K28_07340 [Alistipes sp.]|nr:hypothetical protein [Alistipes sp.]